MSQKETTDILGHQEVSESSTGNLSKLAGLARQAYEQKHTKDCLDLTRAILLIDPDNAEAQWMRSSVQSQIHRDLENARAFLQQAQSKDSPEGESLPSAPVRLVTPFNSELEGLGPQAAQETLRLAAVGPEPQKVKTPWVRIMAVLVVLGFVLGGYLRILIKSNHGQPSRQKVSALESSKPNPNANIPEPATLSAPPFAAPEPAPVPAPELAVTVILPATEPHLATDRSPVAPLPAPRPVVKQELPVVAAAKGTLAVSSPTSVDIYEGEEYLGSAPVSLELPAGMHTLEYRHGNLRRAMTHLINANQTAKAMVAFDATVQINSKPWAEVFLDGVDRKDLGQTPLSGVRVPIGSVLIFQNPQFQPKKYRVTGNETGIQIVFP